MVEVSERAKIVELKKKIEMELKVAASQQTLVYMGKTLVDEKSLDFYPKIKDGAKVHLIVKKPESLHLLLDRFLMKYYSQEQTKMILDEFMRDFSAKVESLSLDDLERIATSYLSEES